MIIYVSCDESANMLISQKLLFVDMNPLCGSTARWLERPYSIPLVMDTCFLLSSEKVFNKIYNETAHNIQCTQCTVEM